LHITYTGNYRLAQRHKFTIQQLQQMISEIQQRKVTECYYISAALPINHV